MSKRGVIAAVPLAKRKATPVAIGDSDDELDVRVVVAEMRAWDESDDDDDSGAAVDDGAVEIVPPPQRPRRQLAFNNARTQGLISALVTAQQAARRVRTLVSRMDIDNEAVSVPAELLDMPFELNQYMAKAAADGVLTTYAADAAPELINDVWDTVFGKLFCRDVPVLEMRRAKYTKLLHTLRLVSRAFCRMINRHVSAIRVPAKGATADRFLYAFDTFSNARTVVMPMTLIMRTKAAPNDEGSLFRRIEEIMCTRDAAGRPFHLARTIRLVHVTGFVSARVVPPAVINEPAAEPRANVELVAQRTWCPENYWTWHYSRIIDGKRMTGQHATNDTLFINNRTPTIPLLGTFNTVCVGFYPPVGVSSHAVAARLTNGQHLRQLHVHLRSYDRDIAEAFFTTTSAWSGPVRPPPLLNINTGRVEELSAAIARGELPADTAIDEIKKPPVIHLYKETRGERGGDMVIAKYAMEVMAQVWPDTDVRVVLHVCKSMTVAARNAVAKAMREYVKAPAVMRLSVRYDYTEVLGTFAVTGELRV